MMSSSWFFSSLFVSTSLARPDVSVEISVAWASRKCPDPGLARRAPKTAQMDPGLSGTENLSEMIALLIKNSYRIGPLPGSENLASPRRILERRNAAVARTP